jgi:hypothetical protein
MRQFGIPSAASSPSAFGGRTTGIRLFTASIFLLSLSVFPCAAVQLTVGPAKPENAGTSLFVFSLASTSATDEAPKGDSKSVVSVPTTHYLLLIDLNDIEAVEEGSYFRYKFYVRNLQPASPSKSTYFLMNGRPIGDFPDQRFDVPFTIDGEEGKISLPIFSLSYSFLSGPTWTVPEDVGYGSTNRISIHLTNQSSLSISATFHKPNPREDYWQEAKVLIDDTDKIQTVQIPLGKSPQNTIDLQLTPKPATAFISSIFSFAGRSIDECRTTQGNQGAVGRPLGDATKRWIDDCVTLNVEYHTKGGLSQSMSLMIPVRFRPNPALLFLCVILGCGLGLWINALVNRKKVWPAFRQDLLLVVLIGVLVEAFSMIMVSLKSNLRIFGFDLDPFQLLPAALIGVLIGLMGFDGVKHLAASISGLVKQSNSGLAKPSGGE